MRSLYFISFYSLLNFLTQYQISSISAYTITPPKSIKDGETLSSQSEIFDLGFFSSPNSKNRYLGVWYRKIPHQTIVWVANRDSPLNDSSGVLTLSTEGNLVILSQSNHLIWSTNLSTTAENPIVEFLDSGNLVLRNRNSDGYLWQSFDHPSDTLLPGMKLGWDLRIGLNRYLTSWKSVDDPSTGDYNYGVVLTGDPETFIKNGSNKYYRSGPFNGIRNSGAPDLRNNSIFVYNVTITETEVFYTFQLVNQSVFSRLILTQTGNDGSLKRFTWVDQKQSWILHVPMPRDRCDAYGLCGPGSTCDTNDIPVCQCIKGFKPKSPHDWDLMDLSRGCERKTQLACDEGEWSPECERGMPLDCDEKSGFMKLREVKLPDTMRTWVNRSMSLEDCKVKCSKNCSCMAYANADIREGGSGCVMWFGDLLDIRNILGAGQDLYVRMATSDLEAGMPKQYRSGGSEGKKPIKVIIAISAISSFFLLGAGTYFIMRKKIMQRTREDSTKERGLKRNIQDGSYSEGFIHGKRDYQGEKDDLELNLFNMDTIVKATDNFCDISMLGKGGFGCVYKGTLEDGQEIAVKRLSKNSGQGEDEFKNEVMLIARLQHRNLVRLLGFCIEKGEKMLIYEYLQNKSLDAILFDRAHNFILDWKKRFNIISGISRGLLYLHQDSRFRIIHRDLKASNVLLDGEMNPKISDFGMARIFGGDDTEAKTKRVMGTYGYMSPEYAMDGIFSVKSDVFSFGVLVLEIISGKKNKAFFSADNQLNLLGYVWTLWKEGNALEVIDETVHDSLLPNEALRCIQVGLLCVQECAGDRPTMSSVVFMLNTDIVNLPQPRQPGFCFIRSSNKADSTSSKPKPCSGDVTITTLEARC